MNVEACKSNVCRRPLFANPVTIMLRGEYFDYDYILVIILNAYHIEY